MRNKIIVALLFLFASAVTFAASPDYLLNVDALQRETIDIDAMSWAWRITNDKDPTYDDLKDSSGGWIMTSDTKALFFTKLKNILNNKASRPLTVEETKKRDETLGQIRRLLSSAGRNTAPKKSLSAEMEAPASSSPANAAPAQDTGKAPSTLNAVLSEVDIIQREMLDIDVMYWAWRVTDLQDITYTKLEEYSKNWVMTPKTKELFFAKLKKILDSKTGRSLTAEERIKHDESLERIRHLLSPGMYDTALVNSLSTEYCIELDARHWAYRVQKGEKVILKSMINWNLRSDIHKQLMDKIKENLPKKLEWLNKEELYKLDACTKKLNTL